MSENEHGFTSLQTLLGGVADLPALELSSSWLSEVYGCDLCHDAGYLRLDVPLGDPRFGKAIPCPYCGPRNAESSGIPDDLRGKGFEDFDLQLNPGMKAAYERCLAVARGLAWCAVLVGDPGLGKTLLAVAALKERYGRFWTCDGLLRNVRHLCVEESGPRLSEEAVLGSLGEGNFLLVVDDLGAEKRSDWTTQTLYTVLNTRYQLKRPTILTSNLPDALDERIVSRYAEGLVACEGRDIRKLRALEERRKR